MEVLVDTKQAAKILRNRLASHLWPSYSFDELGLEAVRILRLPDPVKGAAIQKAVSNFSRSHPEEEVQFAVQYLSEFFVKTVFALSNFIPLSMREYIEFHSYTDDDELIIVNSKVDTMT